MPRWIFRFLLTGFVLCAALFGSRSASPLVTAQSPQCAYDFTPVTNLVQNAVNQVPLDGASLLLIQGNKVIYEKYFGSYNADTTVFIASASKWLAAATLMTQVDEGKLSLADPVSKYLPYFTGTKGTITIRQLFSHTSGLPGIEDDVRCLGNPLVTMDNCVRQIALLDLIGQPGAQFAYGENSMQVAGRICEVVSGKSWESLFKEKVAVPIGMASATFGASGNPIVAGGARLKLNDYANFLRMILNEGTYNDKRVLSTGAVREMQRNLTAGLPVASSPLGSNPVNYAIGEWVDALDAQGNAIQLSSAGAFGFTPWVDKKRNLIGVFLVQNQLQKVYSTVDQIQQKVREIVDSCTQPVTSVSAASYSGNTLAPEAITSAFGGSLATATTIAATTPLPNSLAGTSLRVLDSLGAERLAPLFFVSPTQINFQLPMGTSSGMAKITVTSSDGKLSVGTVQIAQVAPGIFSADASGRGIAAATLLRIKSNGSQSYEPVAQYDSTQNKMVAIPIDFGSDQGNASDQLYLILFGTGVRFRSQLSAVSVKFGGTDGQVQFAGAQDGYVGLDQLNVLMPRTLAGRGEVDVVLMVDGKPANSVKVNFK